MLTENTAQKARLPLCADRRIARARLLVDALLEASELTAEKLTAALRSILAELRCASDVLAQNRALEILEAIQYALEMGQEPGSILAESSIIRESMREFFTSPDYAADRQEREKLTPPRKR